jgi:hypothetical protein
MRAVILMTILVMCPFLKVGYDEFTNFFHVRLDPYSWSGADLEKWLQMVER